MQTLSVSLSHLLDGVSQQATHLRKESHGEAQINALSSTTDGVKKRPPTVHEAALYTGTYNSTIADEINGERYIIAFNGTGVEVYGLDGTVYTVNTPDGVDYITTLAPLSRLSVVSVGDHYLILNKEAVVAMDGTTTSGTFRGTKQLFGDLPATGTDGDVWEIVGDKSTEDDNYYMKWVAADAVWRECAKPGISGQLDAATMPHKLSLDSVTGEFTFEEETWAVQEAGDRTSVPLPPFVGKTLTDITAYRGRLQLLSGKDVFLTRAGDMANVWPRTLIALPVDDPIHVYSTRPQAGDFYGPTVFDDGMILFTARGQFAIPADQALSPQTANLVYIGNYNAASDVAPLGLGSKVYFTDRNGKYASVRNLSLKSIDTEDRAPEITEFIPKYIPGGVHKMFGSTTENILGVLTSGAPSRIYVFKQKFQQTWTGAQRVQSSWSYWDMGEGTEVLDAEFSESTMYILIRRGTQVFSESLDLSYDVTLDGVDFLIHLDRKVHLTGVYDEGTGYTSWTLPYDVAEGLVMVPPLDIADWAGDALEVEKESAYVWRYAGDFSAAACTAGIPFRWFYDFSRQHARKQEKDGNTSSVISGRVTISKLHLAYADSGSFSVVIQPSPGREVFTSGFTWRVTGKETFKVGSQQLEEGTFSVPVSADASTLKMHVEDSTHLPAAIVSAEWDGTFSK